MITCLVDGGDVAAHGQTSTERSLTRWRLTNVGLQYVAHNNFFNLFGLEAYWYAIVIIRISFSGKSAITFGLDQTPDPLPAFSTAPLMTIEPN
jgi:hypothetical protein